MISSSYRKKSTQEKFSNYILLDGIWCEIHIGIRLYDNLLYEKKTLNLCFKVTTQNYSFEARKILKLESSLVTTYKHASNILRYF